MIILNEYHLNTLILQLQSIEEKQTCFLSNLWTTRFVSYAAGRHLKNSMHSLRNPKKIQ